MQLGAAVRLRGARSRSPAAAVVLLRLLPAHPRGRHLPPEPLPERLRRRPLPEHSPRGRGAPNRRRTARWAGAAGDSCCRRDAVTRLSPNCLRRAVMSLAPPPAAGAAGTVRMRPKAAGSGLQLRAFLREKW